MDLQPGPLCPWSAACGGCDMDGAPRAGREATLRNTVAWTLGLDSLPTWIDSPRQDGYRARIKLAIENGRVGYRGPRSHVLVEPGTCRIARPEIQTALPALRAWVAEHGEPFASVELRSDGTRVVHAFASKAKVEAETRAAMAALGDIALDGRPMHGRPTLELEVAGIHLRASPASFFQVNLEVNALLGEHARAAVAGCERVLDLYAGIGNLGLPIAARGTPVLSVEAPGSAADDLRHNIATVAPARARAIACRIEDFDPTRDAFDAAILDPPRAGAPGILPRLARQRPRRIVLVSCHAPSAARDLRELRGYRITSATCFDLFPATSHVELVLVLEPT